MVVFGAAPRASAQQASSEPASPDPGRTTRTLGWISIAIGGEAAVVAIATSFMLLHQKSVRDADCSAQKVCSADGLNANGTIDTLVPWNTASWIVAVAGIGAGTALLITSGPPRGSKMALAISPTSGGAAVGLWSSF